MAHLPAPAGPTSSLGRAFEVATDIVIATAVMWAPPLLLGAAAAVVRYLWAS
jgi:hypothetical protein